MTDAEYRELYSSSPAAAQQALFEHYFNYVYAVVFNKLRSCGTHEDIEECVSDVFSAVFIRYEKEGFSPGELKGLIATIATRKAISAFRSLSSRSGQTAPIDEFAEELPDGSSITADTERAELQSILLKCVNDLGEPDSTIMIQKYYYNLNSSEIASKLSMTPAAVRVRSGRALKKLRDVLLSLGFSLKEGNI